MRFILAPILLLIGIGMMRYTVQITEFTGKIDFAERTFSAGLGAGTYTWWRLIGLTVFILGALWLLGMMDLIGAMFAGLLGVKNI